VIFTLFVLWCHTTKSCRFRLQECGGHKYSILQMSLSWIAVWIMAEFYWENVQYFVIYIKYENELLNVLVRNALEFEKISLSCCHIVSTFRIMQLILVYWSRNLWTLLRAVPYLVFKWNPQRPNFTIMNKNGYSYIINVMTRLQLMYYSPVHCNI
jgi:hypothetical protein